MSKYTTVNAKLANSQLNKLKHAAKNNTNTSLRLSLNLLGKDENEYPHKLFLTNTQVNKIKKGKPVNIKFSKTQIEKIAQSGGFLGALLKPLMKFALPLAKNVLAPLALTAAASAADAGIQKKIRGGNLNKKGNTTLIISNSDLEDIKKIIKCLEESGILIDGISEAIENETKEQKGGFLGMLLGTLGASLLGNMLAGKGVIRAGEGIIRAGENF